VKSRKEPDLLDLERDIPSTEDDTRALRRSRTPALDFEAYLSFLESMRDVDPAILARRKGPSGDERFPL
jgi:hypothetical protein